MFIINAVDVINSTKMIDVFFMSLNSMSIENVSQSMTMWPSEEKKSAGGSGPVLDNRHKRPFCR